MSVTDLTGTKWHLNETLSLDGWYGEFFLINFTCVGTPDTTSFDAIVLDNAGLYYDFDDMSYFVYNPEVPMWNDESYRTVTFVNGSSVQNSRLIAWIEANAEQVVDKAVNKVQVVRGGQTEALIDLTADTAIASDVAQGKYFHLASGERVVGTATGGGGGVYQDQDGYIVLSDQGGGGGGGASNVVYGSFTTNASEGAQTINIPYSGSGYPIMVSVFHSDGSVNHTSVYGVSLYTATKSFATVAPTFTGDANADKYSFMTAYRTNNNSFSGQVNYAGFSAIANDVDASGTYSSFTLKLTSNSTLSVYVQGESYGLLPSAEYKYVVAYSE